MKYIDSFHDWKLNETMRTDISPVLRKSLDTMSKSFENDDQIIEMIEKFGFERQKTGLERTADYRFIDDSNPRDRKIYISYTTGYVRMNAKSGSPFTGKYDDQGNYIPGVAKGPITDSLLHSSTDRLLFILRRAMKKEDLYNIWKKDNQKYGTTIPQFFERFSGHLSGKKYGV